MPQTIYRTYKILGMVLILLAALLMTLRVLVRHVGPSPEELTRWIQTQFPYPIRIQSSNVDFSGWDPVVKLAGIEIEKSDGTVFPMEKATLVFSPYAMLLGKQGLRRVLVDGVTVKWPPASQTPMWDIKNIPVLSGTLSLQVRRLRFTMNDKTVDIPRINLSIQPKFGKNTGIKIFAKWVIAESDRTSTGRFIANVRAVDQWNIQGYWQPVNANVPCRWEMHTDGGDPHIHIAAWDVDIGRVMDIAHHVFPALAVARIEGRGDYVSAKIQRVDTQFSLVQGWMKFSKGIWQESVASPGCRGLAGNVSYREGKIKLNIETDLLEIAYFPWLEKTILLHDVKAGIQRIPVGEGRYRVHGGVYEAKWENVPFVADLTLDDDNQQARNVQCSIQTRPFDGLSIATVLSTLPRKKMDATLVAWLDKAIQAGQLTRLEARYQGDPGHGTWEADVGVEKLMLAYHPKWPSLVNLAATLQFRDRALHIQALQGEIAGGPVVMAQATIPDVGEPIPRLSLSARFENRLEQAVRVIQESPLQAVAEVLSALKLKGNMVGNLALNIPLTTKDDHPIQVQGSVDALGATVSVPEWGLAAHAVRGKVHFTQDSIHAKRLTGKLFGEKTVFALATRGSDTGKIWNIEIKGKVSDPVLKKQLAHDRVLPLQGSMEYTAQLDIPSDYAQHPWSLRVASSLHGMGIHMPAPFDKAHDTERNTVLTVEWEPNKKAVFHVDYGELAKVQCFTQKIEDRWEVRESYFTLGQHSAFPEREEGILWVKGALEELDIQAWQAQFFGEKAQSMLMPRLSLDVGKLILHKEIFLNTHVEAHWNNEQHVWHFEVDGPSLKGKIAWPTGEDPSLVSQPIQIDLKKLVINTKDKEASLWASTNNVIEQPMAIKIKKLTIDHRTMTDLEAYVQSTSDGYEVPRLQAKMKNTEVTLAGQWDVLSEQRRVNVKGKVTTRNTTDLFKAMGMKGTVHQAKGDLLFSLRWEGEPFTIDYPTLTGKASFRLSHGYVQGVDPGIGRVLNLLSVDTVQRRLNFDFSDLTRSGFSFDEFSGKFRFGKGKVSSNRVILKGPSANIESYGQADLSNQGLSGELIVMPNVTGSLPVAAAIAAGNPAVGAAVWIVDKMVGKKLQEIHRYRYRLVGTWDAPKLEEIPNNLVVRG